MPKFTKKPAWVAALSTKSLILNAELFCVVLVLSCLIGFWNIRKIRENNLWVVHAYYVLAATEEVSSSLKDAETGQRGYIITKNRSYLDPYTKAVAKIKPEIQQLRQATLDDPQLQAYISSLEYQINAELNELSLTIALADKNLEAARQEILSNKGKNIMDSIRAQTSVLLIEEQRNLNTRQKICLQSYSVAIVTLIFLTLTCLVVFYLFYWTIKHHLGERNMVEEKLLQAKMEADNANLAKSQFLANMSHELRTPMNAIIGMTDLVLMTELTDMQKKNLGFVKSGARRLLALINNVLDLAKIEARKVEIVQREFNIREIIRESAITYQTAIGDKAIKIDHFVSEDIPEMVIGDPLRLHQILGNLLSNAIKFTESGKINITANMVEHTENSVTLEFFVADTGMGIPPDKMSLIFDYFRQATPNITQKYGGSGLGLAISQALVQEMGGEIKVESEIGKGSTFHFSIHFKLADHPMAT